MQEKGRRQQKILGLIRTQEIATQTRLVKELRKAGFDATQSSVSRDLVDLGIAKMQGAYVVPGTADPTQTQRLRSIRRAGDSLVVLKTDSGFASAITVAIDKAHIPEIIGTIAGDDTIFIAVNGRKAQDVTITALNQLFERDIDGDSNDET